MKNIVLIFELVVFVAIVVLDAIGIVPISQTIYLVPFILISLKLQKQPISSIGWKKPQNLRKYMFIGISLGILIELTSIYLTTPGINLIFNHEPDYSQFSEIKGNVVAFVVFLLISWILGGLGEEIAFRGFFLNRLEQIIPNVKFNPIIALVICSIVFGVGHTEQGIAGWVIESLNAIYLGIMFYKFDRSLFVPIVAHGTSNTLALLMIYFGTYPGVY